MKAKDLKEKVIKSKNSDLLLGLRADFKFGYINYKKPIKGVLELNEYVNRQIDGWNKVENVPNTLLDSKQYFLRIKDQIREFINSLTEESNEAIINNKWETLINRFISGIGNYPLPFDTPQADFLIEIAKTKPDYFAGAFEFICKAQNNNINTSRFADKNFFFGSVLAYEFETKDFSEITQRKNSEKRSISLIRSHFEKHLSDSEHTLNQHIQKTENFSSDYVLRIDELRKEKEENFNKWFDNTKNETWGKWFADKLDKIEALEQTYETKLKLEKPARYWEKKSIKYYKEGNLVRWILTITVALSALFIGSVLIFAPDWIFTNIFKGNEISFVRWAIMFFTLISLITYAVRALTKYMFSAFHLARDAEERHTLTFFYLSLMKDSNVDEKDRQLIMQALFSRVETGLLQDDSSPTMPNDVISRILQK